MNWLRLNKSIRYLLNFPGFILVLVNCASATIGLLYLQDPFDFGFQYFPGIAAIAYFLSRILFALEYGVQISRNEILAYLFVLATAISVGLQIRFGIDALDRDGLSALDFTVAMWAFNIFHFFAGPACNSSFYKKSNIFAVCLLLLVVIPIMAAPKQGLFLDYWELREATGLERLTHLIISEWCVFLFVAAFAFADNKVRPVIVVVSVVCLFGLQGRSSTLFSLFTFLFFWMLTSNKKVVFIYTGLVSVILVSLLLSPLSEQFLGVDEKALDRMILDSEDNSLNGRNRILTNSLQHLPQAIPYGDPTYIANEAGSMGSYIHNILSMWQFFGLLPFVLILILLVRSLILMKRRIAKGNLSVMEEIACMLLIYVSVSVILSKSVVFYWLWFAVGYWMLQYDTNVKQLIQRNQRQKARKKKKKRRTRRNPDSQILPAGKFRY